MLDNASSNIINFFRWFAALLVLVSHARYLLLVNYSDVHSKNIIAKGLYFVTGFGHESVVLFFVISGFLVGGLTIEKWKVDVNVKKYAIDRFSRIYTVLIPALILGGIIDFIGLHFFNSSELYTNSAQYHTNSLAAQISAKNDFLTMLGNVFMLQGRWVSTFGSNNPLWSLSYEWWYYTLFAVAAYIPLAKSKRKILMIGVCVAVLYLMPMKAVIWGGIWMLGLLVFPVRRIILNLKLPPYLFLFLFFLAFVISRLSHNADNAMSHEPMYVEFFRDLFLGVAFMLFIASIPRLNHKVRFITLNRRLADFSYSTYLFHFPLLIFIVAYLNDSMGMRFQNQPDLFGVSYFLGVSMLIGLLCYVFYFAFESRTRLVKNTLNKWSVK